MKTLIFVIALGVASLCSTTSAKGFANENTCSVQARFSDLTLKHFQGTLFSGQKKLSLTRALRIGVSGDWFDYSPDYPSTTFVRSQEDSAQANAALFLQLVKYHGKSRLKFYWGGGSYLGFSYKFHQTQKTLGSDWEITDKSTKKTFDIGASALVGCEYFLNDNISIMAEYMTLIFFQHERRLNRLVGDSTVHSWLISPQPMKVGVAIYF